LMDGFSTPASRRAARLRAAERPGGQSSPCGYVAFLHLEAREVLPDLPRRDLLVVPEPLIALHPGVVIDVVLAPAAAEGGAPHVVRLQLADRLEEVAGKGPQPALGELL